MRRALQMVGAGVMGACAVGVLAALAQAATTYQVSAGATTSGTATLATRIQGVGDYSLFNLSAGVTPATCSSSSLAGTAALAPARPAAGIIRFTGSRQGGCETRGGNALTVTQRGTWVVNAAGATSSGVTKLAVTKMNLLVTAAHNACSYVLTGSADATYRNNGTLTFTFDSSSSHRLLASHAEPGTGACETGTGDQFVLLVTDTMRSTSPVGRLKIVSVP